MTDGRSPHRASGPDDDLLPRLVCFGNLTVDDLYLPDGTIRRGCVGGDALYAALGARLWEERTAMLAPIGADLPKSVTYAMEQAGVAVAAMPRRAGTTIRNQVHYALDGTRRWVLETTQDLFHELSVAPSDIPEAALHAEAILLSAMSLEAQEACVGFLRSRSDALLALDLQEDYIWGNEQRILDLVAAVDLFLPSEEEARRVAKREDWEELARWFGSLGPSVVAIKFAERGSLIYSRADDSLVQAPARRALVVDSTGAGDAYCGGFLAMYLRDPLDLGRAARAGAVSAAFAVSGYGTDGLLAADKDVARRQLEDEAGWLAIASLGPR
jgi:sugar/nucleoside kinase (ribokinase family)